jgi:hypothetical protein
MIPTLLAAALVWLPPETFTQWSRVDELLRAQSSLKLTIALTPQMATPLAKAALAPWAARGRVELAARIQGDPVLPLTAAHPAAPRPDDALERAAEARGAVERRMGAAVAGFVPGGGALAPSLIDPLGASGAAWVLVGPYDVSASSWASEGRAVFVPARDATGDPSAPGAFVVDESSQAESSFLTALRAFGGRRPKDGWVTVAELVKAAGGGRASADDVASWPGWNGKIAEAPSDPSARAAWNAYGEAAKTLSRYENSGAADLKVLENATRLLRKAQDARYFRAPEPGAAGLPAGLRASLLAVYNRVKAPAPDALYDVGTSTASAATAEAPTGVHAASGSSWLAFDNPVGTIGRAPAGAPNADPWRLRGLRVEWNDERVLFRIYPGRVDAAPAAPRPVYDVYVDLNHLVGAGSIRLLDGRDAFAQARDAWEFALTVTGSDARLLRAGAADEPDEIAKPQVESDPAQTEIRVSVPRALLHGNPAHWGYILLSLADDSTRQILGLLAPLEVQKTVLENPGSPQRVPAARLER